MESNNPISTRTRVINVGNYKMGGNLPIVVFAGPNVIEPLDICLEIAEKMKKITGELGFSYVFKSSYFKPNRTDYGKSAHKGGFRGPGLQKGLDILSKVREQAEVPIVCDVHSVDEAISASKVIDVIQIPAANCKHMDIVLAAGSTGKAVKIKKGQWLSPWEMTNVVNQMYDKGYNDVMITERGTFFGYKNLVIDIKSIPILKTLGAPVVLDCAHTVAFAEGNDHFLGAAREYIPYFARAGVAAGVDGLFFEIHPNPNEALSNPVGSLPLHRMESLLKMLKPFADAARSIRE